MFAMERKPIIILKRGDGKLLVTCTEPKLRNGCSFVKSPGKGHEAGCIEAANKGMLIGLVDVHEEEPGLEEEALKSDPFCV